MGMSQYLRVIPRLRLLLIVRIAKVYIIVAKMAKGKGVMVTIVVDKWI